jgi:hypothetical protein
MPYFWVIMQVLWWILCEHCVRSIPYHIWVSWNLINHRIFRICPDPYSSVKILFSSACIFIDPFYHRTSKMQILGWG